MRQTPVWKLTPARVFWILLGLVLLLRLGLLFHPGYVNDVQSYKGWAMDTWRAGIPAAYEASQVDYPPLIIYLLWLVAKVYLSLHDATDSSLFTALVKLPYLLFDLGIATALLRAVKGGLWGEHSGATSLGLARTIFLLYFLNPAVIFDGGYWGQSDVLHTSFALVAVLFLGSDRWFLAGACLSAACLTKPVPAPLVPLLALVAALRGRLKGFISAGSGGLLVALLAFAPYLATGRIVPVLRKVIVDIEAMPLTSVNAHSIWWLTGGWKPANAPLLGPLTPKQLSLLAFSALLAAFLIRVFRGRNHGLWQSAAQRTRALFLTAGAIAFGFFAISTHMHENHLFMVLPFLLATSVFDVQLRRLYIAATIACLFNMVLHDPEIPYALGPLSALSPAMDPHLQRPYTWLQVVGTFLNTMLVLASCGWTLVLAWRVWGVESAELDR